MILIKNSHSTFNQLIGANISCLKFTKFDKDFAEQYCWTQGIYTHIDAYDIPAQTPYPGIAPCVARLNRETGWAYLNFTKK